MIIASSLNCFSQEYEVKKCNFEEWAKEDSRTQGGGFIWFPGKGIGNTIAEAYFFAEGLALSRLVQECQSIPLNTRIVERCDHRHDSIFNAYVRVNVTENDCKQMRIQGPKSKINEALKKILNKYEATLSAIQNRDSSKEFMKEFAYRWNSGEEGQAMNILEKKCLSKDFNACHDFAYYENAKGNIDVAEAVYEKNCNNEQSTSCYNLAILKRQKRQDIQSAKKLFEKSCFLGLNEGCYLLSKEYENELNQEARKVFLERGCSKNHFKSCSDLASSYLFDLSFNQSEAPAIKACKGNIAEGCETLAFIHLNRNELSLSQKFFKQACKNGEKTSCNFLKFLREQKILKKLGNSSEESKCLNGNPSDSKTESLCFDIFLYYLLTEEFKKSLPFFNKVLFSDSITPESLEKLVKTLKTRKSFDTLSKLDSYNEIIAKHKERLSKSP